MSDSPRILIVDDEPGICRTLSDILEVNEYSPQVAGTGQQALDLVKQTEFAVVLIDLRLPDLPGMTVLQEVKSASPYTEAIVVTGHASLPTAIEAVEHDAFAYLEKPVDPGLLLAAIRRAVQTRQLTLDNKRLLEELQAANQALEAKADELARSNSDLAQFAYVASHDLQEPLRGISGCLQLLVRRHEGKLDADSDELITLAVDSARRMQTLIKDLLAYSRVGTRGKDLEPTDPSVALEHALANLSVAIQESGATVTHGALPTVMADRGQLTQLFQNLIGNAIKFRKEQPPKIHLSVDDAESEDNRPAEADRRAGMPIFAISDNGIGIDPKFAERIFAVFQRLHTRDEYPGTGIGLAICKRIVERHGGHIWIRSQPGEGTTFYFTLPAVPAAGDEQDMKHGT